MRRINAIKIRSDIEEIIMKSDQEFQEWYSPRKEATEKLLRDYELFASIPNLEYENDLYNLDAKTIVKSQIDALKEGIEYLEIISRIRGVKNSKSE